MSGEIIVHGACATEGVPNDAVEIHAWPHDWKLADKRMSLMEACKDLAKARGCAIWLTKDPQSINAHPDVPEVMAKITAEGVVLSVWTPPLAAWSNHNGYD